MNCYEIIYDQLSIERRDFVLVNIVNNEGEDCLLTGGCQDST